MSDRASQLIFPGETADPENKVSSLKQERVLLCYLKKERTIPQIANAATGSYF